MPMHYVSLILGAVAGLLIGYLIGARRTDALRRARDEAYATAEELRRHARDLHNIRQ